ncbi:hypothetical protein ABI_35910 [Asticcacaulis biprosthecium C19]|uniref:Uncharacterized protein n=1 Tax=Asticcacaulis biprosthecium C19 TaxID=715226 RepID=F4QQT0_9CAUL|nr:hypothetical protein ABI_35910 [Asticcacaulis biprosthecium C19]
MEGKFTEGVGSRLKMCGGLGHDKNPEKLLLEIASATIGVDVNLVQIP